MKVYLLRRNNEKLDENTIVIVGRKADAEKLVNDNFYDYYIIIEVLSGSTINEYYQTQLGRG